MLSEKAKSRAQQRFFGMVRAAQKGELENPSPEVADVAGEISKKDAKDFAKTKHKGLPEKKKIEEVAFLAAAGKTALAAGKGAIKQRAKQVIQQKAADVARGAIPQPNRDQQEGVVKSLKKFGEYLAPTPGKGTSNEPSVAAGTRTPQSTHMFKHVPSMNKGGTTGQYGKKGSTAVIQGVGNVTKTIAKSNFTKAALPVAGAVGAGLAVSKGVDSLMKLGKKKKVNESKGTAELAGLALRGKKRCAECGSFTHVTGDCPKKDHSVTESNKYKGVLANPMKEAYRVLASSDGQEKPSQFSYKDEKTAKKYADSIKKGGGKATVTKESVLTRLGRKKKVEDKKPEKAMDAGARAKRLLQRRIHAKYVSGSEDLVPDDIRDHYEVVDEKVATGPRLGEPRQKGATHPNAGEGEKIQKRTLAWMRKKGMKGSPGLNAMKEREAEHRARNKSGVRKEEVELDERLGGKGYKPYTSLTGKKVSGDWEDSDRGAGNKATRRAGGKVEKKSPTYLAHVHNKEKKVNEASMVEARVDKGRSDYGKATIRNWRHSGPSTVDPAMFDPENKRGKTIDKRRAEHKARRGVKGAKVPVYGVKEEQVKSYEPEGELVDETYFDTNRRGISTKGGFVKQYNKPGKLSRASLNHERKSKNPELRMSKKELRKSMEDDANYEKKMGRSKPTPSDLKTALKKQSANEELSIVDKMLIEFSPTPLVLEKKKQPSVHDDYYDPMEDPTFDPHEAEATRGQSGRGTKGKMNVRKKYPVK